MNKCCPKGECCPRMYVCPKSGCKECLDHGGFSNCCDHPLCPGNTNEARMKF